MGLVTGNLLSAGSCQNFLSLTCDDHSSAVLFHFCIYFTVSACYFGLVVMKSSEEDKGTAYLPSHMRVCYTYINCAAV